MIVPLFLLIAHFFGDFVLQDDWMALNKSKDLKPLLAHVGVYTLTIAVFVLGYNFGDVVTILTIPELGLVNKLIGFLFLTFGSHLLVDAVTSRVNAQLWFMRPAASTESPYDAHKYCWLPVEGMRHWFFVAIGVDQLLHFITLAYTYQLVFGR